MAKPTLGIIVASTRPGRRGLPVAKWIESIAIHSGDFPHVELIDLACVGLPLLDEPLHPKLGQYQHEHTRRWSAIVAATDAFILVMPEYNFGFNAALKNALDYLFAEWAHKAVAFVSYGGASGGIRAVQMLKQVVTTLRMMPVFDAVSIPHVTNFVSDDDTFQPDESHESSAAAMMRELRRLTDTLEPLRRPSDADARAPILNLSQRA